jgi:hypothetical protein
MEPAPACLFAFVQKWANAELLPTTRASAVAAVAVKIRTLFIPMPSVLARAELHDLMVSVIGEGGEPVWSRLWNSSETRRDATSIFARAVAHEFLATLSGARISGYAGSKGERYAKPRHVPAAHELRPLTADDMRGAVPEEYLIIGALICPQCGLIYSRAFAERYGETPQAA